ncbi:MAG: metallophosphoesterase family protein [Usitatibacter sp.]
MRTPSGPARCASWRPRPRLRASPPEAAAIRTIVHLSDLHFGKVDPELLEPLRRCVEAIAPHLVVVSGDLTQRAKAAEFRAAKTFLDTLPKPQLVVPGNHDVPLYNVFQRFLTPLRKYKRIITPDLEPAYIDDEIAVVGVNTARSLTFKDGNVNSAQIAAVKARICGLHESVAKIIVTHHPFDVPEDHDESAMVDHAARAMEVFASCGADIMLSGHLHKTNTSSSSERYKIPGHAALIVQAGTATSVRGRGESNSFNALHLTPEGVSIECWQWNNHSKVFELGGTERFLHAADGWHRPK